MISRKILNFGQIGPMTLGLSALGHLIITPYTCNGINLCLHSLLIVFNSIHLILAGYKNMH